MSPTRKQSKDSAAGGLKPCMLCGHPRWWHAQSNGARRSLDWHDDGHAFKSSSGWQQLQMALPYQLEEIQAGPTKIPAAPMKAKKKPPQRVAAPGKKKRKSA